MTGLVQEKIMMRCRKAQFTNDCVFYTVVGDAGNTDDEGESDWIREEEEEFRTDLDKNKDGVLDRNEIYHWLIPDNFDHINEEAQHLLSEADVNQVCATVWLFADQGVV